MDIGGQKAVPYAVVKELREKVRNLSDKAAKADQLEAWQRENEPALRFLQNNKDLLIQRAAPEPQAPAAPQLDPDAREAALLSAGLSGWRSRRSGPHASRTNISPRSGSGRSRNKPA